VEIFLREIERTDLIFINKWRNDSSLISSLGSPFRFIGSDVDVKWYEQYLSSRSNNIRLAICKTDTHVPIGAVYLLGIDWVNRAAEFSIWLGDHLAQGQGVGDKSTRLMLDHAILDLNIRRVSLTLLASNEIAYRLYKKVGFIEEGRLRQAVFKNGHYIDLIQMAILDEEYTPSRSKNDTMQSKPTV
jgi:RimJ/RimL family protein N-acetyltransferase